MNDQSLLNNDDVLTRLTALTDNLRRWRSEMEIALHHGCDTHNFDDLVGMILANNVHFYSFDTSFTVMELIKYPRFSVYHCFLAGGQLDGVIDSIKPMSDVARALGCRYLSMAGREGWKRELQKRGWQFVCTTQYLDLGSPDEQNEPEAADDGATA